jgi:hypothetical protein
MAVSLLKVGSRVRAEGTVDNVLLNGEVLVDFEPDYRLWLPSRLLTVISEPIPAEPPIGSVVYDHNDDVWQRETRISWVTIPRGGFLTWETLVKDFGPLYTRETVT